MTTSIIILIVTSLLSYLALLLGSYITGENNNMQCAWLALVFGLGVTAGLHAISYYRFESQKEFVEEWINTPGSTIKANEYIITLERQDASLQDIRGDNHIITKRVDLTIPEAATLGVVKTTNPAPAPNPWLWKLYLVAAFVLALFPLLKNYAQTVLTMGSQWWSITKKKSKTLTINHPR